MCMEPILFVDYTFSVLHDGSIKMDSELTPEQLRVKNGDIYLCYVTSGSIFLRKYTPSFVIS